MTERQWLVARRFGVAVTVVFAVLVVMSDTVLGGRIFSTADNIFLYPPFNSFAPAGFRYPSNFLMTDPLQGWLPTLMQARHDLSHGVLPLWDPDIGGGHPLFASQIDALLYPLTWLTFILPFEHSFAFNSALRLALAMSGTYLFGRDLKFPRGAALLAGVAYAFCTFFVSWLQHPQTYVWLCMPWMFWAVRRICARGGLGATATLAFFTGLCWLGGHPESAAYLMVASGLYALFELVCEARGAGVRDDVRFAGPAWTWRTRGRLGLLVIGFVVGVCMGMVEILPLKELIDASSSVDRGAPPMPLHALVSFAFPGYWGMPNKQIGPALHGPVNYAERTAYIGAIPTLLAFSTLGRRRPREVWFFVGLAVLSFILVFNVPWLGDEIRRLPGGNVTRLTRWYIVLAFAGAMLAGYGLQQWFTGDSASRRRQLYKMLAVAVLPVVVFLVTEHSELSGHVWQALDQLPTPPWHQTDLVVIEIASVWRWLVVCIIGLGAMAICWRLRRTRYGRWTQAATAVALLALTILDLGTLDRNWHGALPEAWARPAAPPILQYMRAHQGSQRITALDAGLFANITSGYGLRDARIAIDVPFTSRYQNLWTGLDGATNGNLDAMNSTVPQSHQLSDDFAVHLVYVPTGSGVPKWVHVVYRGVGGEVGVNRTALPRAWVAYDWRPSTGQQNDLALTLASKTGQLERTPVIEQAPAPPQFAGRAPSPTVARVTDTSTDKVTIHATAKRAGYLVLDDSAYPGWKVTVDGHSASWLYANENFRAVAIPAGAHTIVFHYEPASVYDGAIISAVAIAGIIGLALGGWVLVRRRRAVDPGPPTAARAGAGAGAGA